VATDGESLDRPIRSRSKPGTTPEARESQLIAMAVDRAAQQIQDGTASAQVITHFLKLGSSRERLEQQRIAHENELLIAKRDELTSRENVEALYKDALSAMSTYQGREPKAFDD
jgi:hypothetical protein